MCIPAIQTTLCSVNGALGFWEIARQDPDRTATVDRYGNHTTFGELGHHVDIISQTLFHAGVSPSEVVAALIENSPTLLAVQLAVLQLGAYFTPLSFHSTISEVSHVLGESRPKIFIASEACQPIASSAADALAIPRKARVIAENLHQPLRSLSSQKSSFKRQAGRNLFFTSGTTGRQRGVHRPIADILPETILERALPSIVARYGLKPGLGVHLVTSPLSHVAPNLAAIRSLHLGHSVVFLSMTTAEQILKAIETHRITTLQVVPTTFSYLLALPAAVREKYDLSSLTHVMHVGARCPIETKRKMIEWLGPILHETYAATEISGTYVGSEDWLRRPGTVGRAIPGSSIKIMDEAGVEVPVGIAGVIYMKREGSPFEYLNDLQKTVDCSRNGFVTVGDIGYLDRDGWLFVCDRRSDLILSGGMNVYPAEVEDVLVSVYGVIAAAVVGVPDSVLGQRVVAVVETTRSAQPGELAEQLVHACREKLATYKLPTDIKFGTIPRSESGKVNRNKARDAFFSIDQVRA